MKQLSTSETIQVGGGFACFDKEVIDKVRNNAYKEGMTFAIISTGLGGAALAGISGSPLGALALGVVLFPYVAIYGYTHSSAWNMLKD